MASSTSQGCDFSLERRERRCAIPSTKRCSSIFTRIDIGQQSHVSVEISERCLFDSIHISFLLCRTREVYLSFLVASAINSSILTAFS
jgi:hypothetical protein